MISIKIFRARELSEEYVQKFLNNAPEVQIKSILETGYMLEVNNTLSGCFMMEEIGENVYELKHFYLVTTEAIKIPILFEAILTIAKQKGAQQVFVKSQKLMTDILLRSLGFYPQTDQAFLKKSTRNGGKWWLYTI